MSDPQLPIYVPAAVRQGNLDGFDTTTKGQEGLAQTHRGRKRDQIADEGGNKVKGHMIGNEDISE